MKKMDLNCDRGESFGIYKLGVDEEAIQYITSANIACGFHAVDPNKNVLRMVVEGETETMDGELFDIKGDSICVHGDTTGAVEIIKRIREKLQDAGVEIAPVSKWQF
jgi:lactam utilization protein B